MPHQMAVLGTGGLGTLLGEQVKRQPRAKLAAIADVSERNRDQAGEALDLPAESRYETLQALLEGESLDALVIVTPHTLHYDQIITALDRDLDVLCEKPLVTDLDEARDLDRRASASETVLMVGYQRHLLPEFQYARERWAEGTRQPDFVSAEITEDWLQGNTGTWRVDPSLSGGGFLSDTGSHVVDAVLWTTGLTPTTVRAEMTFYDDDIDTRANVTVEFEEEATAHLSFHSDVPRVSERVQGWDDEGSLRIAGREWGSRSLTVVDSDGSERDPYLEARDSAYETPDTKLDAFVEAIEGVAPVPATTRDAVRATAVTEAAYESAHGGKPVTVDLP